MADRWHLLGNLGDAVRRRLARHPASLRVPAQVHATVADATVQEMGATETVLYPAYLVRRWQEDCRTGTWLWQVLLPHGCPGSLSRVYQALKRFRQGDARHCPARATSRPKRYALPPRQGTWLLVPDRGRPVGAQFAPSLRGDEATVRANCAGVALVQWGTQRVDQYG